MDKPKAFSKPQDARDKSPIKAPTTPPSRSETHLVVPMISPVPRHRFSPVLEEFSLRRTPSRGGTASPVPARGVRKRLHQYRSFDHAVDLVKQSRKIVVLTGAGISTSVGIPDFRSDKGLYSQLSKDLGITEAEEFFSRDYFVHNTEQFFKYVRRVIPGAILGSDGSFKPTNPSEKSKGATTSVPRFSLTHAFLALLHAKQKLLTNYTQNIDGLELAAGLPHEKLIQCHGSWDTASCMTCGRSSAAKKYLPIVFADNVPYCKCKLEAEQKQQKKQQQKKKNKSGRKRSWDDFDSDHSSDDGRQAPRGLLKPNITFFNERLSGSYGDRLDRDKREIDLLIIIGTSLKVGPVQDMLYQISAKVPQIFISKERFSGALCSLPGVQVDIELLGECDLILEELCRRARWSQELDSLCWEPEQMQIKGLSRKTTSIKESHDLPNLDQGGSSLHRPDSVASPLKKLKSHESHEIQRDDTMLSLEHVKDRVHFEDVDKASVDIPGQAIDGLPRVKFLPEQQLEVIEAHARADTPTERLKPLAESRVKIELVEGTAHQWRISRK